MRIDFPKSIWLNGNRYFFDMIAPLTGNVIYQRTDEHGNRFHAVLIKKES